MPYMYGCTIWSYCVWYRTVYENVFFTLINAMSVYTKKLTGGETWSPACDSFPNLPLDHHIKDYSLIACND